MEGFTFEKIEKPYWADETVWLNIMLNGKKIGDLALLSKKAALACGIKVLSAVLVELDMDELVPFRSRTNRFVRSPEFPMNDYDLSFLVDSMVKWDDIYAAVMAKKNELLRDVKFVDEYKGKQIPAGKKSVTIRLVIGSDQKTLTGDEIEQVANSVLKRIAKTTFSFYPLYTLLITTSNSEKSSTQPSMQDSQESPLQKMQDQRTMREPPTRRVSSFQQDRFIKSYSRAVSRLTFILTRGCWTARIAEGKSRRLSRLISSSADFSSR
jgi:hypothetical protein